MVDWMSPTEAMNFFGVDLEGLERIIMEYDIDIEVDDEGNILQVNAAEVKEPLFEEHKKNHGHRPDDPGIQAKVARAREKQEEQEKQERTEKKQLFLNRMV